MSATTQTAGAPKRESTHTVTKRKRSKQKRSSAFWRHIANIYRLTIKELRSIRSDPIMLVLVAYSFTFAIYAAATGASTEATNLSIGIVDEDHSVPVASNCRWPDAANIQIGHGNHGTGNGRRDGFTTFSLRH